RAARAPHAARLRQPAARARLARGRRHLPPARRHARPQRRRSRRALGRRHHVSVRRPVLRLSPAYPLPRQPLMSTETLLELARVSFAYPAPAGRRAFALSEVSLSLSAGEMVGVIGPNSSGKTTLIRLLTRVLEPATGEIRLEGVPVGRLARTDLARRVGVVPQSAPAECPFNARQLVL